MNIACVVAGIENPAAGTSHSVVRLCQQLAQLGLSIELHTPGPEPRERAPGVRYRFYPRINLARGLMLCPTMKRGLTRAVAENAIDIIHSHGFWLAPNLYAGIAARRQGRPLVLSPRGMLSTWAMTHKPWKRAAARALGYLRALEAVTCFHATSASEAEDIRRLGFRQPIAIVPNGIDLPGADTIRPDNRSGQWRRVVFLSRIHPKKGIPILLRAWRQIEVDFPDWRLVIAGPDEGGHLAAARALSAELRLQRVSFPGPAYGDAKSALYRSADLFVLPTHSENFGLVIGEALAHAVPVITTTGAPWRGLIERRCGWWIDLSEETLVGAMREAMALPREKLAAIGMAGRRWVETCYAWDAVGRATAEVYRWLLASETEPPSVLLD
jgi:glycosyltransferase involved in cell wall biosynthesis